MTDLFINGKFTAQRTTGVQRSARNLLQSMDDILAEGDCPGISRAVLLLPPGTRPPDLRRIETAVVGNCRLPLHLWEQCLLPIAARQGLLLNLAGSAPLSAFRQVCLIHDAAVFDCPDAYSMAFRQWYRALFQLLARRQTALLTVSAFSQWRLASQLGIAAAQIGIVPNGGEHLQAVEPDLGILARHGLVPERYLLAVGSDNPNKNQAALVAAFAAFAAFAGSRGGQAVKLVMVGGADPRVFAGQSQHNHGAEADIVRTGPLDDSALKALYQHAAGLIFPSLYEGFGLPPLEAMSCGCPVAASDAAAIPEVCGGAALYFDPSSVDQIACAMKDLIEDPALRERLRRAGSVQLQRFSWPGAAKSLLSQLQPRLQPRRRGQRKQFLAADGSWQ